MEYKSTYLGEKDTVMFLCHFLKGDNFFDFPFASLDNKRLLKIGSIIFHHKYWQKQV